MADHIALATGGDISYVDKTTNTFSVIHTFTSSGTFTKTTSKTINGYYLIVAGGGAGGSALGGSSGGGGGGGGLLTNWGGAAISLSTSSVTVGTGGSPAENQHGNNGGNSVYANLTAIGGGGGGLGSDNDGQPGKDGGSAGGPGSRFRLNLLDYGGYAVDGQGNRGGRNVDLGGGGGGGRGGSGGAASGSSDGTHSDASGGDGGPGLYSDISGTGRYFAAGGGGGSHAGYVAQGGSNIGGNGAGTGENDRPTAGVTNTGSGGGGGGGDARFQTGAAGSSGIVILRYDVTRYKVTKNATTNGKINNTTTQSSQWVTSGDSTSFTVTPNTNYRISQITLNGAAQTISTSETNSGKTFSVSPASDTTLAASFTLKPYATINAGSGGSINASSGYVDYNVAKSYTATAASGYYVISFKVNGVEQVTASKQTSITVNFTPTANYTISATFSQIMVTTVPGNGGTITPGTGYANYNQETTYTVTPNPGWAILSVSVDGASQSLPNRLNHQVVVRPTAPMTIAATFAPAGGAVYQHFM